MKNEKKEKAMVELIHKVYPNAVVEFDRSRRAKSLFAKAQWSLNKIRFYRPLFKYDLFSCLYCAIHEMAHFVQHEISGYSAHDKEFGDILKMMLADYGTAEIARSKHSTNLATSRYTLDREEQSR